MQDWSQEGERKKEGTKSHEEENCKSTLAGSVAGDACTKPFTWQAGCILLTEIVFVSILHNFDRFNLEPNILANFTFSTAHQH